MLDLANRCVFPNLPSVLSGEAITAMERVGLALATVMVRKGRDAELGRSVERLFGIRLPDGPEWTSRNGVTYLGTGPGKWLAISEPSNLAFVQKLEADLNGVASVVDQSGGLGVLRLSGPALFDTLAKGVQIDLAPDVFPTGAVAVTSIAHIGGTLWKVDDLPTIDIAVARSLSNSFLHWLEVSAPALSPRPV